MDNKTFIRKMATLMDELNKSNDFSTGIIIDDINILVNRFRRSVSSNVPTFDISEDIKNFEDLLTYSKYKRKDTTFGDIRAEDLEDSYLLDDDKISIWVDVENSINKLKKINKNG